MAGLTGGFWDDIAPRVDGARCQHCAECAAAAACPVHALSRPTAEAPAVLNADFCLGCYACVEACPQQAVQRPRPK